MIRLARPGATLAVLAVVGATALAACGKSTTSSPTGSAVSGVYGSVPPAATGAQHAGPITVVQPPNSAPTWILPIITSAFNSVYTVPLFDYELYRPLYWLVKGTAPQETPALSLAADPKVSNGGKTFTINLKTNYKWSNGKPITSQDVLFWYYVMKAGVTESPSNWAAYTPKIGLPDQVASVTAPNATTVVFTMKSKINPIWFWQNELGAIQPMPAAVWSKTSASGPIVSFTSPANAKKIYDFLAAQSKAGATWATNPLWKVVNGPYQLASFNTTSGAFTMTPNPSYGGPHAKTVSKFSMVPFTSDTAEYNAVRSGSLDVGYVPLANLPQISTIKSLGYQTFGYPDFGWLYVTYNFKDTTGHFDKIIGQLYMREVMAHLQNQQGSIKAFFNGAAGQAFGPVPSIPKSPYTPSNALVNPYPFSISTAASILKAHGWKVVPNGITTCASPGSGPSNCGAGIPAGTKLSWNLIYTTTPTNIGEQVTALASEAKKVGINLTLSSSNFNYMVSNYNDPTPVGLKNINKWAMMDFGGFTNSTYPTTFGVFNCQGSGNLGGYCDPQADKLINASLFGSSASAVTAEAQYLTTQQPGLFEPNPASAFESGSILVWKKTLSGPPDTIASITQFYYNPEMWYFTK